MTIVLTENEIINNWFHKKAWSGGYLKILSYQLMKYKRSVVNRHVDKAILLSND